MKSASIENLQDPSEREMPKWRFTGNTSEVDSLREEQDSPTFIPINLQGVTRAIEVTYKLISLKSANLYSRSSKPSS